MSLKNDTLPNEFWKHLGKFDLTDYAQPRWSILVNDNGLQCTLYWSVPGATPPSPPSSPEKEEAENKIEAESGSPTQPDTAKTIQALLQHRIQQLQQNNKQYMRNLPMANSRPGMKRKESPQAPKAEIDSQMSKRVCVNPSIQPPMCSSPTSLALASTLTPSVSASSHNSASPNQSSNNEDGTLLIDEGDENNDDDSLEDILKKNKQQASTLPHIPKNLAHNLQAQIQQATKNIQMQQKGMDMASLLSKASHLNNLKLAQRMGGNRMLNSAQQLLSSLNNSVGNQSDIKDEADSDLEEIMCDDDSDRSNSMSMMIKNSKSNQIAQFSSGSIAPSQGQFGMGPPTGATRPKMEAFIGERNKMMDLELLRQRFSNPLARPTLTKFVYALTRLLFTDDEIIAPLRDLDQEKIDWIFDETYRMFPGCTYPTVKNAVGQVGRTKRYRAKYALGAKDSMNARPASISDASFDSMNTSSNNSSMQRPSMLMPPTSTATNFSMLQGLPSLLANLPPQLTQQQLTSQMQSLIATNQQNSQQQQQQQPQGVDSMGASVAEQKCDE